jgi:trehalose-6-phosphate synthase
VSESLIYCDFGIEWFVSRSEPEVAEWVQVLKLRYAGMKIAVGRDKLDEVQVI